MTSPWISDAATFAAALAPVCSILSLAGDAGLTPQPEYGDHALKSINVVSTNPIFFVSEGLALEESGQYPRR